MHVKVSGGILLGLGLWIRFGGLLFSKILGYYAVHFLNIGCFSIVIGVMLIVLGFLGCLGAVKESRCLLMMFIMIMLVIFIAKIAAAILALTFAQMVETVLYERGSKSLKEHYTANGKDDAVIHGWDTVMQKLKCCGFNNYTDFSDSEFINNTGQLYPKTCCRAPANAICDGNNINSTIIFMKGCFEVMREKLQNNSLFVGGAAAAATALELASIFVAMVLFLKVG